MKLFLDYNEIELLDDLSFNIMSLASYGIEYLKDYFVQDCESYELMVDYAFSNAAKIVFNSKLFDYILDLESKYYLKSIEELFDLLMREISGKKQGE